MVELILQIATIASPIIAAVAIWVALRTSKQSSKEATLQLRKLGDMLDTFVAAENVKLVSIKQENEKALNELEPQITKLQERISLSNFDGNARIEVAGKISDCCKLLEELNGLLKKKEELELEKSLIISYLQKVDKQYES